MKKKLPNLHKEAFMFKNTKRFQHDGGRAWIKDGQLHESRRGGNGKLHTIPAKKAAGVVPEQDEEKPSI